MFESICTHIKYATNKGNIRSAITIFPPRTDGKHDFRIWNNQLISYAGYKNADDSVLGDPLNVEFTEVCLQLGWKKQTRSQFDVLPLVLSANGHDPEWFDLPADLVYEIKLTHPNFDWFPELGLQWYALPAVANMLFDCGGLQFPAAPFNGWYMATEIGARDLGDVTRYNQLEAIWYPCYIYLINIEHETLVLVVTSTFGNGDPPENGEKFAKSLYDMKRSIASEEQDDTPRLNRSLSFMRMNSVTDAGTPKSPNGVLTSQKSCPSIDDHHVKPLSNVRYAVFALGSSAYPNFCAFGTYVDQLLGDLGGERLLNLTCGDELAGQEQQFNLWAGEVFKTGCETFCLDDEGAILDATAALKADRRKNLDVKLIECDNATPRQVGLARAHVKKGVQTVHVIESKNLHPEESNRHTQQVIFDIRGREGAAILHYSPGDHLAVLPCNSSGLVQGVVQLLAPGHNPDTPVHVMVMRETHTPN
ncbi:nitric oxide synthase, salivary gland-like, partial [Hyalella azteca]|uniref:nitric-oxide synthase (NADPH) n=1 Tax=Hyalella azteca TaxID=294128 RepID=A0A979FWE8_HYAAZ